MINRVEICGVNTSKLPVLTNKEKDELFIKIKQGDEEARNEFINGNLRLVLSVIRKFYGRGENLDDLFQVGCIGLIKAIDNFDLKFDVKFSTYAVPMISGEIKRFLRDDGMVKVSRGLKETASKVYAIRERMEKHYGREPTLEEVSKELGVSREDIVLAMEANREVESIYKTVHQGEGNEIYLIDKVAAGETAAAGTIGTEDTEKEKLLNHMLLLQLLTYRSLLLLIFLLHL